MLASLPRPCLLYFLENCQLQIEPDDDDGNTKVRAIFKSTQIMPTIRLAPQSLLQLCVVDIPGSEDDEEEPSANKELSDWLVAVCEHLRTIQSSSRAHADEMTEKHGLVLLKSIGGVMAQLNNAIDVSALRTGLEQLASIHALTRQ